MPRKSRIDAPGALQYNICRGIERVSDLFDIEPQEILQTGKQPLRVQARSLVCYWAVSELGISATEVGRRLGLSQSAVSRAVPRGRKLADEREYSIEARNA